MPLLITLISDQRMDFVRRVQSVIVRVKQTRQYSTRTVLVLVRVPGPPTP